jgi:hypothetical protein
MLGVTIADFSAPKVVRCTPFQIIKWNHESGYCITKQLHNIEIQEIEENDLPMLEVPSSRLGQQVSLPYNLFKIIPGKSIHVNEDIVTTPLGTGFGLCYRGYS